MKINIPADIAICAVTKSHSISEVEALLKRHPQITDIAENRWPDCEEKFRYFAEKRPNLRLHFIGPLQSNKITKVVALCDVIQSVESFEKLIKINECAKKLNRNIEVLLQVNISGDPLKHGISPAEVPGFMEKYLAASLHAPSLANIRLAGFMTIGEQTEISERFNYFSNLKKLFAQINAKFFTIASTTHPSLEVLSMGMSSDYPEAIAAGSTMVRLGTLLFDN